MSSDGLVIFGIGPISKTIFYACKNSNLYNICAFTADIEYIQNDCLCELPVVAFEVVQTHFPPTAYDMLVVNVGSVAGTTSRKDMFLRAQQKGYRLINYIDPRADVTEDIVMGQNNIIMAHTHVSPSGTMGDNNFIRENTYLGHDFLIGDHNFLGPGCNVGGSCRFGNLNFIGMGTTVINNIEINNSNLIGAGSVVIKPVGNKEKYAGNPARKIGEYTQPKGASSDE